MLNTPVQVDNKNVQLVVPFPNGRGANLFAYPIRKGILNEERRISEGNKRENWGCSGFPNRSKFRNCIHRQ